VTKLFVTDIDGTLVGANGEVHPRDAKAIKELLRKEVPIALCTGRMFSGTRELAATFRLMGPVACIDGSHIFDLHSRGELSCTAISREASTYVRDALRMFRPAAFMFSGDRVIHDVRGERFLDYLSTWSDVRHRVPDVVHPEVWQGELNVAALVLMGDEESIQGMDRALHGVPGLQDIVFEVKRPDLAGSWGMVVRADGVDKGTAVAWLAEHYGVGLEDVVAVGDWLNDVPMLERAGLSFAMAQAPAEVRAAAKQQLRADIWQGGGVAEAAERAGLI
jgi:Cof subfamily protein (haloacid dehalogenase superfamily)